MSAPQPTSPRSDRKRVLVVLAGAFDPARDDTPLANAETPALDRIARRGRAGVLDVGAVATAWEGFCALLGLGPNAPSLAAADALGAGVAVAADEAVWRADFVTVEGSEVRDLTAGGVADPEATALLDAVRAALPDVRFHRLDGPRNLAVSKLPADPSPPPSAMISRQVAVGLGQGGRLRDWYDAAHGALAAHDVNQVRIDLSENPANGLWFHGAGPAAATSLTSPYGARGTLIGRGARTLGLARALSWNAQVIDGDVELLAAAALAAITAQTGELIVVRADTALLAAAAGTLARRDALSALDARLIAPIFSVLEESESFALAVTSDQVFDSAVHAGVRDANPCAVITESDQNTADLRFVETALARSGFHIGVADLVALLS